MLRSAVPRRRALLAAVSRASAAARHAVRCAATAASGPATTTTAAAAAAAASSAAPRKGTHGKTDVGHNSSSGTRSGRAQVHKLSSNTADASAYVSGSAHEVPSFSASKHMAFLALHGRRIWLPLVMLAGYASFLAPLLATPLAQGMFWSTCVLLQRLSVHGRANSAARDLSGHVCVVTGGTSGVGLYTAQQLLSSGAHVVIASKPGKEDATRAFLLRACASSPTADADAAKKRPPLSDRITFLSLDYSDQLDVMAAAARVKSLFGNRLDMLVNCAGVWKEEPGVTRQGFEEHVGVNFLGPFHFTEALLPSLRRSTHKCGRVVYVTCASHNGVRTTHIVQERMLLKPGPDEAQLTARCYSASKLGNIYHAQSIALRRYEGIPLNRQSDMHPVDVLIADPGFCSTNLTTREVGQQAPLLGNNMLGRTVRSLWIKDAYEGSQTVVNCCLREDFENGGYYHECTHMNAALSKRAQDAVCREEVVRWAMAKTIAKYYATTSTPTAAAAGSAAATEDGKSRPRP